MDSRLPPPQGAPPPYAFVARVYKRSLRPIVLAVAFLAGLWTLFAAIGYFRNAALDRMGTVPKLRVISIVLGALYMTVAAIEALGLGAAATQRLPLVRTYAYLSAVSALIIIGTGLLRIIIHFTLKNDIINACSTLTEGDTVVFFGFWGPVVRDLDAQTAREWCTNSWNRDSWEEIISFIIISFLAAFFSAIAFSYLRQVLDPSSPANASRAPSQQMRTGAYPSHYNPPYNPNAGYGYGQSTYAYNQDAFVPPYEPSKLPEYSQAEAKPGFGEDTKDPFGDHHGSSSNTHGV